MILPPAISTEQVIRIFRVTDIGEASNIGGMASDGDIQAIIRPFHHRANEAEERLAKLEAALARNKGSSGIGQGELLTCLTELRAKMEKARLEQTSEREKALKEQEKLATENAKLQYRISHLVRSLKEADEKLRLTSS